MPRTEKSESGNEAQGVVFRTGFDSGAVCRQCQGYLLLREQVEEHQEYALAFGPAVRRGVDEVYRGRNEESTSLKPEVWP